MNMNMTCACCMYHHSHHVMYMYYHSHHVMCMYYTPIT